MNTPVLSSELGFYRYVYEVNNIPSLTLEEERDSAIRYIQQQDISAAHKLVTSHLKLVVKIAMQYKNYGLSLLDIVSEGNIGLMHAVKKFDPSLGYRLSTYASWWIKAFIQDYVLKSWSLVKIGTTAIQKKLFFGLRKLKRKLINTYCRDLNHEDYKQMALELGATEPEVIEMGSRLYQDVSLNNVIRFGDNGDTVELIEQIKDGKQNQELILINKQEKTNKIQILNSALSTLGERERDIFISRKLTSPSVTLEELSKKYQVSKERIRQIENAVFEKVKRLAMHSISAQVPTLEATQSLQSK